MRRWWSSIIQNTTIAVIKTCPYPVSAGGRGQILEPTETDPPHENHDGHKEGHRWEDKHGVHFLCKGK